MDEELVSESSDTGEYENTEGDGRNRPFSFTRQFELVFPWYLSIGMSPEQFWEQDCRLAKAYREAERYREDRFNTQAHLQGMYIYEALCDVAPILHAFAKSGTKPVRYSEKPYELTYVAASDGGAKEESKSQEEIMMEKNLSKMEAFAIGFNKQFLEKSAKKEETTDA